MCVRAGIERRADGGGERSTGGENVYKMEGGEREGKVLTERKSFLHRALEERRARAAGEVSWPRLREEFAEARWTSQRS